MKSVISIFFTTLMIVLPFIVSEKRCLWRFNTCKSSASAVCEVTLRYWCVCPSRVSRGTVSIYIGNTTYCAGNETLNKTYESVQSGSDIPEMDKSFCDRSTCRGISVMCQWQMWQLVGYQRCGNLTERRRRYRCCHPVSRKRQGFFCGRSHTEKREVYRDCGSRNPDGSMNFDNYPLGAVPRERDEGLRQETKVTIVIVAFAVFVLVAAIIGKRVGRPICQRRQRLPVRRNSLPIVLQLPERNQPAPKSVIIPQPGQPLPSRSGQACSTSPTDPMIGPP